MLLYYCCPFCDRRLSIHSWSKFIPQVAITSKSAVPSERMPKPRGLDRTFETQSQKPTLSDSMPKGPFKLYWIFWSHNWSLIRTRWVLNLWWTNEHLYVNNDSIFLNVNISVNPRGFSTLTGLLCVILSSSCTGNLFVTVGLYSGAGRFFFFFFLGRFVTVWCPDPFLLGPGRRLPEDHLAIRHRETPVQWPSLVQPWTRYPEPEVPRTFPLQ